MQELFILALHEAADRDAGPFGYDAGHGIGIDVVGHHRFGFGDRGAVRVIVVGGGLRCGQFLLNRGDLAVRDAAGLLQVTFAHGLVGFYAQVVELGSQIADLVVAGLFRVPTCLEAAQLFAGVRQIGLQLLEAVLRSGVFGLLELHLLHFVAGHLALQFVDFLRRGVEFHTQVRGCLVDQVDGLVGQLAAGDIPVRQGCGGDQRIVADRHLVVRLVTLLQTTQDRNRVFHARFADEDLLEAAFQCRILFDVLSIFVERGRTDQA